MRLEPAEVSSTLAVWREVSAGRQHTCARNRSNQLACWGHGANGRLGTGDSTTRDRPVELALTQVAQVRAGQASTCAVTMAGELYCWGTNQRGQIGSGEETVSQYASPILIGPSSGWEEVRTESLHTCALRDGGELWCWGEGASGELGLGTRDRQFTPQRVGAERYRDVAVGSFHSCAVTMERELFCWGGNGSHQLGLGEDSSSRDMPQRVDIAGPVDQVSADERHSCARSGSSVYCWGGNNGGQLGTGDVLLRQSPPTEPIPGQFVSVDTGGFRSTAGERPQFFHTCGVQEGNRVYCWGDNDVGQLGVGDMVDRSSPARVCFTGRR